MSEFTRPRRPLALLIAETGEIRIPQFTEEFLKKHGATRVVPIGNSYYYCHLENFILFEVAYGGYKYIEDRYAALRALAKEGGYTLLLPNLEPIGATFCFKGAPAECLGRVLANLMARGDTLDLLELNMKSVEEEEPKTNG